MVARKRCSPFAITEIPDVRGGNLGSRDRPEPIPTPVGRRRDGAGLSTPPCGVTRRPPARSWSRPFMEVTQDRGAVVPRGRRNADVRGGDSHGVGAATVPWVDAEADCSRDRTRTTRGGLLLNLDRMMALIRHCVQKRRDTCGGRRSAEPPENDELPPMRCAIGGSSSCRGPGQDPRPSWRG